MLVLSRKQDEQILIGENISLRVVMIRGDQVQLALEAPRQAPIHRVKMRHRSNHSQPADSGAPAQVREQAGASSIPAVPAEGALLAATLRSLAVQTHRVLYRVSSGHPDPGRTRIHDLLQQIARLKEPLRERGQGNVLLRWLDSVERRLEAAQNEPL